MPIEVGIWRINGTPERVLFSSIATEHKLEEVLHSDIGVLDPSLMIIGRQVPTAFGKLIDLLAIDVQGDVTIIELKRDRTPREVVAQTLDYASWVQNVTYEELTEIFSVQHPGQHFEQAFSERFDTDPPDTLNENHQLIVVASELDPSTERIIDYLSTNFGVPINAVLFRYFKENDSEYLVRSWLIDPAQVESQTSKAPVSKGKEAWNGKDFYVSLGEVTRAVGRIVGGTGSSLREAVDGTAPPSNNSLPEPVFSSAYPRRATWEWAPSKRARRAYGTSRLRKVDSRNPSWT